MEIAPNIFGNFIKITLALPIAFNDQIASKLMQFRIELEMTFPIIDKGRFDDSILVYKKAIQLTPNSIVPRLGLAATYSLMGRENEARAEAEEVLKINPKFSLNYLEKINMYKDRSLREKYYFIPLRKAGMK